jgi:hypothetical protein
MRLTFRLQWRKDPRTRCAQHRAQPQARVACRHALLRSESGLFPGAPAAMSTRYASFREFYPFYLSEHADPTCRRLHFIGSTLVLVVLIAACVSQRWALLWLLPLLGYGFAWVGHFFFERNRPATFSYPLYSFAGDWVMYWQVLSGRLRL